MSNNSPPSGSPVELEVITDTSNNKQNQTKYKTDTNVNDNQNQQEETEEEKEASSKDAQDLVDALMEQREPLYAKYWRRFKTKSKKIGHYLIGKDYEEPTEGTNPRYIFANKPSLNKRQGFASNYINTTKYSIITFLPKNLLEQFARIANFYFLVTAIIQLIPGISPISPITSILPLVFVLSVTAIKEGVEDIRRGLSDRQVNNKTVDVIRDGTVMAIPWSKLQVGDITKVERGQPFPADMVFLATSDEDGLCYIETSNLDGETNLKTRDVVQQTSTIKGPQDIPGLDAYIYCEGPNNRVEKFEGTLFIGDKKVPLSFKHFLLRGCELRDTKWIYGLVTYTGHETKLMMNSTGTPSKRTRVERDANYKVRIMFLFLAVLVVTAAIATGIWTESENRWYLGGDLPSGAEQGGISLLVFFIILNTLIPISLYVSMEFVKVFHAQFINYDLKMYDKDTDTPAKAKTSNLQEELGQIEYVFCDKTGTLTRNVMEFRKCTIAGVSYGEGTTEIGRAAAEREGKEVEVDPEPVQDGLPFVDDRINHGAWKDQSSAKIIEEFFTHMALCHTVIPSSNDSGEFEYQATSPDEGALVDAAAKLGFKFLKRSNDEVTLEFEGKEKKTYKIEEILEFDSFRKRMSVVVRYPDDSLMLLCKGADNVVFERLAKNNSYESKTKEHIQNFGDEGLRTLCYAQRKLSESEFQKWAKVYGEASTATEKRDEQIRSACELIEKDLELLGASAIEDKLQEGVPQCIEKLRQADMKVWVLTGDKKETAINIGFACLLLDNTLELLVIDGDNEDEVVRQINNARSTAQELLENGEKLGLVVTGQALQHALKSHVSDPFAQLAIPCESVVCCRCSPLQKAEVVKLMKEKTSSITLAIGDGANDVPMIQSANVGIGISGKEGAQAVLASDYAIAQYRFLQRLLLIHGRWDYRRIAKLLCYSFYKNIAFTMTQFWFAIYSGFSGMTFHDSWHVSLFNVLFTSLPILFVSCLDQDATEDEVYENPHLYRMGQENTQYSNSVFLLWVAEGLFHSLVLFFFPFYIFGLDSTVDNGRMYSFWAIGTVCYTAVVLVVNLRLAMEVKHWNILTFASILFSILIWFIFSYVYNILPISILTFISDNANVYFIIYELSIDINFWLCILLCTIACLFPTFAINFYLDQRNMEANELIAKQRQMLAKRVKDFRKVVKLTTFYGGRRQESPWTGFSFSQAPGNFRFDRRHIFRGLLRKRNQNNVHNQQNESFKPQNREESSASSSRRQ
eukprot:gb/GECH01003829.1/.p1 GENE.gb/GECH01003829.1/~~gb/GECH01003829.1/.p1  ORF type:complete len:1254 (+),score=257.06 gb/GECH01003829.1/:1-3762(+)